MAKGEEMLGDLSKQVKAMETALSLASIEPGALHEQLYALSKEVAAMELKLEGSPSRDAVGEKAPPSVSDHFFAGYRGLSTTYGPTPNQKRSLGIAKDMIAEIMPMVKALNDKLPALRTQLKKAGAPYILGTGEE